jgi:ATP-dependent Clp protease ATP-binding subunit ClpA
MQERFDEPARQAVIAAQDGARSLGQHFIGTEHLLLGIVADESHDVTAGTLHALGVTKETVRSQIQRWMGTDALDDRDTEALATIGIDLDAVRAIIENAFGPGSLDETPLPDSTSPRGIKAVLTRHRRQAAQGHLPLTRRAKTAIELGRREATRLHSPRIENAHLLLGLLAAHGAPDTHILQNAGIDLNALRHHITTTLTQAP